MVPVVFGFPAVVFAVPPLMVLIPATLALGVEIVTAGIGLRTVLAMVLNGVVQSGFGLFYGMLAMGTVVGMRHQWRGNEPG